MKVVCTKPDGSVECVDVSELWRYGSLGKKLDIPRSTIQTAIDRGQCRGYLTADGHPLVLLSDVLEWDAKRKS